MLLGHGHNKDFWYLIHVARQKDFTEDIYIEDFTEDIYIEDFTQDIYIEDFTERHLY